MAGRPLGSARQGDGKNMPNQCTSNPPLADPAPGRGWNGWGNGLSNTRFQTASAAGLSAAQVPPLKLKWAFGLPTGVSANAQPTVVAGRVFVAPTIDPVRNALYVGTGDATTAPPAKTTDAIMAIDINTGKRATAGNVLLAFGID